ncbi:bifunctional [glutamate--ammonia ligase]-adenylyl-L-tyrosine phosphorylase/[glutamate--ammonia-ligase] adenylyltransferase [uncultured Sutterella sp.]|uniref:bifunctional [glutamate--ammonia ligase]-adenylyl-L-tyrosine phosphorylase/[glutamate--ammonia-ligase] adenylyltransferase n=1 Tax=uncultured Sutterella sp. TaxID=286133 RepID=UPI0025E330CB|nr:bifunctional [glutamate--ammonia ligase]-adenylyl-L-tyrosine phosphorylase/[glutamate--ammonia-ligase] adenylyltransferase [uncultured Sutterella sp.]
MEKPTLEQTAELSVFAARSLKAMLPGGTDAERLERFALLCSEPWTRGRIVQRIGAAATSEALDLELRLLRRDLMLSLIGRNATGACGYDEVVETMTIFAEEAVRAVVRVHARELAERLGVPSSPEGVPQDLLVVGMGKLGGAELNVSSDIDLIFLFDEDGETRPTAEFPNARRSVTNEEFYARLARRIIPALNDPEGPGFVFRVDMRLRPNGDAGPIVSSSGMLEEYLYTQGRDWERFAWLKGRVVSGPVFAPPKAFAQQVKSIHGLVQPFVFRKYLDFNAISSLTKLHELVRAETNRREQARGREGCNVKLGRGGIREIEFIVQTLQVIRGGREQKLHGRSTLPMIDALVEAGALAEDVAHRLSAAYVFLRDVEHALQYVDDQQTQWLPRGGDVLRRAAGLLGADPDELWREVEGVREFVASTFDGVFHVNEEKAEVQDEGRWPLGWAEGTPAAPEMLEHLLERFGYGAAAAANGELASRILSLVRGRRSSMLSEEARTRLRRLVQFVVEKCPEWIERSGARVISPAEELSRYLQLLEAIAGRSTYAALLYEYPSAAARVGRVLAASRWSTDYVVRHPIVLDELVDARSSEMDDFTPVDWSAWRESLHAELVSAEGDQERQMNYLRDAHHGAVFRLLVADLDGRFAVERLADQLSALADAVIAEVLDLAWSGMPGRPEEPPHFAVIGYGKLGGKELGYQSDLDLVFLYDDPDPDADRRYSRLVRRMMSALTVQTSSGKLFDVDLRLRPNGENGLAVCSFEMFSRYQRNIDGNGAWLWEHQALTRARFVAGDPDLGRRFEVERAEILRTPRDRTALAREIGAMRARMLEGHANTSGLFDLKQDRGGMVDVEFIVQYCVLGWSAEHPELVNNFGNILLLEMSARLGILDETLAARAACAYRRYRALQHEIRLNAGESVPARVPAAMIEDEAQAVRALWRSVFGEDGPERKSA